MRKLIYAIALVLAAAFSKAQSVDVGSGLLGVGIGPCADYIGVHHASLALRLSYDKGILEAGPGTVALGLEGGMSYQHYSNINYDANYFTLIAAGRGMYYYNFGDVLDVPQLNAYGGFTVGIRYVNQNYNLHTLFYNVPDHDGIYPYIGFTLGANYFLTENIAFFLEAGWDVSYGSIGVHILM